MTLDLMAGESLAVLDSGAIALDFRAMTRVFSSIVAVVLLAVYCGAGQAQLLPVQGRDFLLLDPPHPVTEGVAIEVIEFFYYGCPVCYDSQPHVAAFLARQGNGVTLKRVPAASFDAAEQFALTYYALEATDHLERLHGAVYENHHFDDLRLGDERNLLDWLARNGVDTGAFRDARNSPENQARVSEARRTYEDYGVRGVPSFVVDGRYLTSARLANGVKEMMAVLEYLVTRARNERPK
jgi:thiol:disulfide interchange protein DsbA